MTTIRVRYVPPGSDDPVAGWISFVPRSFDPNHPIAEGPDVLVGGTGQIEIEPGMNTIEVRPTSSGWYYAVQGRAGRHTFTTNVLVPPSGEHDFESLVRVDPKAGGLEYEPDPEWRADLDSIRHMGGVPGPDGADAYQVAVREGYTGSEEEWLDSLVGPTGEDGERGPQGDPGITDLATEYDPGLMAPADKAKLDSASPWGSWNSVMMRDDQGGAQVSNVEDNDNAIVNKAYVDALNPGVEVDTSVGTRVSVGDQVIFYDSGWRDLSSRFGDDVDLEHSYMHVKRTIGELRFRGHISFTPGTGATFILKLPATSGWMPEISGSANSVGPVMTFAGGSATTHFVRLNTFRDFAYMGSMVSGEWGQERPEGNAGISFDVSLTASDTLPTSLIGTPA